MVVSDQSLALAKPVGQHLVPVLHRVKQGFVVFVDYKNAVPNKPL